MAVIRWAGFAGENRAIHPKLLPDAVGTLSRNQKPGRGDLRPWKSPVQVAAVLSGRQTIHRMGRDGKIERNPKQAVAIAMSEARRVGKK